MNNDVDQITQQEIDEKLKFASDYKDALINEERNGKVKIEEVYPTKEEFCEIFAKTKASKIAKQIESRKRFLEPPKFREYYEKQDENEVLKIKHWEIKDPREKTSFGEKWQYYKMWVFTLINNIRAKFAKKPNPVTHPKRIAKKTPMQDINGPIVFK